MLNKSEMLTLQMELIEILKKHKLDTFFQPITAFHEQKIIGYEAFIRSTQTPFQNISDIALSAQLFNKAAEFEWLCWESILKCFRELNLKQRVFMKVNAEQLTHPLFEIKNFLHLLKQNDISADSIVVELDEQISDKNLENLKCVVYQYQQAGILFALNKVGAGYASLKLWTILRPCYIKIDSFFTRQVHIDFTKREILHCLKKLSTKLNSQLIAEGIESREEYQCLVDLGICFGQGSWFASSKLIPDAKIDNNLFQFNTTTLISFSNRSQTIASLIRAVPFASPHESIERVADIFHKNRLIHSLAIVNSYGVAIGIVRRDQIMYLFSSRYGRELYGRKVISSVMDNKPLIFDIHLSLEEASHQLTANSDLEPEHDFIIAEAGLYVGLGNVTDLLKKITELQIRNARYANPLTLLPGNVPINEYIEEMIKKKDGFVIAYCDLDNFKPFNDVYGYEQGDLVIKTVAEILVSNVDGFIDFIGHVGGDDFILIFKSDNWIERCEKILTDFKERVMRFYSETDQVRGGIQAFDRSGNACFYPLLAISIGVVIPDLEHCHSHHDVATLATDAKHQAKKQAGNSLFIDRRQRPCILQLVENKNNLN